MFGFGYISQTALDDNDQKIMINNILIGFIVIGILKKHIKMDKYYNKKVNPNFYETIKITGSSDRAKVLTTKKEIREEMEPGYIYAPYVPLVVKCVVTDANGTREIWQISRWERFKMFLNKIIFKPIKNINLYGK